MDSRTAPEKFFAHNFGGDCRCTGGGRGVSMVAFGWPGVTFGAEGGERGHAKNEVPMRKVKGRRSGGVRDDVRCWSSEG